ncbi:MAG TPA: MarR family winged helix-turn-helix transcriptional regulator [Marmoricola sp.]|nr:MarR family winged helix-turn-helix transcriptional regulator [Marmoricola sp.]
MNSLEPAPTLDPTDELVSALLSASRALVGVSARSIATVEHRVTLTQFRVLVVIDTHGPTRLNQLATRLDVAPSTALRTVDRLIAAGLVDRRDNEQDRREVVIRLTAAGQDMVTEVIGRRRRAIGEIVSQMPLDQRRAVIDALVAFADAADEPQAPEDSARRLGW